MYINRKGLQFSTRDTCNLDHTLNRIIYSALVKYKEVVDSGRKGVPGCFMDEEDFEEGRKLYETALDMMIYAFNVDNEPDINDYDFDFVPGKYHGKPTENGTVWNMVADNPEEYERFKRDEEVHFAKVEQGRQLFAKHYNTLWW